jgi:hypothetical protein
MVSKIVGQLTQDENFEEWWNSKLTKIPYFRNQTLKIIFTEAENEDYFKLAEVALSNFIQLTTIDREKHSNLILKNYQDNLIFEYTPRLELESENKIWEFVYPSEIIIEQNEKGNIFIIASCGCEWEEEHGLQLVFKNGQNLTRVSYNDGQLENDEDKTLAETNSRPWWKIW